MASYIPNPYLNREQQQEIANIQSQYTDSDYKNALISLMNNDAVTPQEMEQRRMEEIAQSNERLQQSRENRESIYMRASAKVRELINRPEIMTPNEIAEVVTSDPDLSVAYATDNEKYSLVNQILQERSRLADPARALDGKTISDEEDSFLGSLWTGVKHTFGSMGPNARKAKSILDLNELPLKDLDKIKRKQEVANDIQAKMVEESDRMTSPDMAQRAEALSKYKYFQNELNKLQLTPEEQRLWDTYGEQYTNLHGDLDLANAQLSDLNNTVTSEEAEALMADRQRDRNFTALGQSANYDNWDYVQATISDKIKHFSPSKMLGEIASTALPFFIPVVGPVLGTIGLTARAAAFSSDALEHFANNLEAYMNEHGQIPDDRAIGIMAAAIGSAVADFYGSKLFVGGLGKSGIVKSIKDDFKNALVNVKPLIGKVSNNSMAHAIAASMATQLSKKTVKSGVGEELSTAERAINKIISGKGEAISSAGVRYVKKANKLAHEYTGTGIQDVASAGVKLAGENIGSTLFDQLALDKFDAKALVDAGVSGLIGGAMFHGVASPGMALARMGKQQVEQRIGPKFKIDSEKDWQATLDNMNLPENRKYKEQYIETYQSGLEKMESEIDETITKAVEQATDRYGEAIEKNAAGEWIFNEKKAVNLTEKAKKQAVKDVKKLNKLEANAEEAKQVIASRNEALTKLQQTTVKEDYEETKDLDSELTEEEVEAREEAFHKYASDEDKVKALVESEKITEEQAKHIINPSTSKIAIDSELKPALEKYGETTAELYEDLEGNKEVIQALNEADKTKFDTAIDDLVSKKAISKERADVLKSRFTKEEFERTQRTDNEVNEEGKNRAGETVPFSKYNKPSQKDIQDALKVDDTTKDFVKENPLNAGKDLSLADLSDAAVTPSIRKSFLNDKSLEANRLDLFNAIKANSKLSETEINNFLNPFVKEVKDAFKNANEVNKALKDQRAFATEAEAKAFIDKINKKAGLEASSLVPKKVAGRYIVEDIIENIDKKELNKAKTIEEALKWWDSHKSEYARVPYKAGTIADVIEKKIVNKLRKGVKDEKKDDALKTFKNAVESVENALGAGLQTVSKEGVKHAYTKAKEAKEFMEEFKKLQKEMEETNKVSKDIAKKPIEDIVADVEIGFEYFFRDLGVDVSKITEPDLVKFLQNNKLTRKDEIRYIEYHKLITNSHIDRKAEILGRLEIARNLIELAKANNAFDDTPDLPVARLFYGRGRTGVTWDTTKDRIEADKRYNALYAKFSTMYEMTYISSAEIPTGAMSATATKVLEDDELNRKGINEVVLERELMNFDQARIDQMVELFTLMKNTSFAGKTGFGDMLHRAFDEYKERDASKPLDRAIVDNLDNLSSLKTINARARTDFFIAIASTNTFKNFFGLVNQGTKHKDLKDFIKHSPEYTLPGFISDVFTDDKITKLAYYNPTTKKYESYDDPTSGTTAYDNLVALDNYFKLNGALYNHVWDDIALSKGNPANTLMGIIRDRYELTHASAKKYLGFGKGDAVDRIKSNMEDLLKNLDVSKIADAATFFNNLYLIQKQWIARGKVLISNPIDRDPYSQFKDRLNSLYTGKENFNDVFDRVFNPRGKDRSTVRQIQFPLTAAIIKNIAAQYMENTLKQHPKFTPTDFETFYNPAKQAYDTTTFLKNTTYERFSGFKEISTALQTETARQELADVIRYNLVRGRIKLQDILDFNATTEDEGGVKAEWRLNDDGVNALKEIFSDKGYNTDVDLEHQFKDIPNLEKFFAALINAKRLHNVVTFRKGGTKETLDSTGTFEHIENDLLRYGKKDFEIIPNAENMSVLASDNFIKYRGQFNTSYADKARLDEFLQEVLKLSESAGKFSKTATNLADQVFMRSYKGIQAYNREVVHTIAGVFLSHLPRLSSGQSEKWVDKQVTSEYFTQKAANVFKRSNFISKNNLGEDLGSQMITALGIRSRGDFATHDAIPRLAAGLAGRALDMAQDKGIIKILYFNRKTGDVTETTQTNSDWFSVVQITPNVGEALSERMKVLNEPRQTSKGNKHLFTDLLGFNADGNNTMTEEQIKEKQAKLEEKFNSNDVNGEDLSYQRKYKDIPSIAKGIGAAADGKEYEVKINTYHQIARINLRPKGTAGAPSYIYLSRNEIIKKDHTYLSYARLVENAFQNNTGYESDIKRIKQELSFLKGCRTLADLYKKYASQPKTLEKYLKYLEVTVKKKTSGAFDRIDQTMLEAKFKVWADFYAEMTPLIAAAEKEGKSTLKLYFPLINTINNRVFVDSLGINPREFKPLRNFFTPVYIDVDGKRVGSENVGNYDKDDKPIKRTEAQNKVLKAIIGFNFGLDTDKARMDEISDTVDDILAAIKKVMTAKNNPDLSTMSTLEIIDLIDEVNQELADKKYTTVNKIKGVELEKHSEAVLAMKELTRAANPGTQETVLDSIINDTDTVLNNFKLRIEVDGLTNGTGIHIYSSGWMGNTDEYSYGLLAGVGIFPADFGKMSVRDFVNAKLTTNTDDSYQRLGSTAKDMAITRFINELAGSAPIGRELNMFKTFKQIIGVDAEASIKEFFDKFFDRDTMKYVLMPTSYGAGKPSLINFLHNVISRKISERTASLLDADDIAAIHSMYQQLARLNGGKLVLTDIEGNSVDYHSSMTRADFERFSVFVTENEELKSQLTDSLCEPIATAANNLISMADRHSKALTDGTEAFAQVYNQMLSHILTSSDFAKKGLHQLTNEDVEKISGRIASAINIGQDASSLGLLKDAVDNSIRILMIRVPSLMKEGKGIVLSTKNKLSKESIASALSPETNHTKDSDIINRCQAAIRESLGAFLGIHDAVMANFEQMANGAGIEMNKQFAHTTFYSYRPLLQLRGILAQSKSWLRLHQTENSSYHYSSLESQLDYAMTQLEEVAMSQIAGRVDAFNRVIKENKPITVNQYAIENVTSYEITPKIAQEFLDALTEDLRVNNMVTMEQSDIIQFKWFVQKQVGGLDFWRTIDSQVKSATISSMVQLKDYINNKQVGFRKDTIDRFNELYNAYEATVKGSYDSSFIKVMTDAVSDYRRATTIHHHEVLRDSSNLPKGAQKEAVKEVLAILDTIRSYEKDGNNADKLNFVTNNDAANSLIEQRLRRLHGRMSTDFGTFSTLNNIVMATASNRVDLHNIESLNALLRRSKTELDGEYLNVSDFDRNKQSVIIDVDEIDYAGLLTKISKDSLTRNLSEEELIQFFYEPYIGQIEQQLKAAKDKGTPIRQIVFGMNKVIDRILFSAINRQINDSTYDSVWNGLTISIVPRITDKTDGGVQSSVFFHNQMIEQLGENAHFYTQCLNNENKDLSGRNFLYRNKFTHDYLTSNYMSRMHEMMDVSYNKLMDTKGPQKKDIWDVAKDKDALSFIGTGDRFGYINYDEFDSANKATITEYHMATGFDNTSINDDGNVRKYAGFSEDELETRYETAVNGIGVMDDGRFRPANKDWEKDIKEHPTIYVGIMSSGRIYDSNAYSFIESVPEFKLAYEKAKGILQHRQRLLANGTYTNRDATLIPVTIPNVNYKGLKVKVKFIVNLDNVLTVKELKENIVNTGKASNIGKINLTIRPDAPKRIKDMFGLSSDRIADMTLNPKSKITKFLSQYYYDNKPNADKRYVEIPDELANRANLLSNSLNTEDVRQLAQYNVISSAEDSSQQIFLGKETNSKGIYNGNQNSFTIDYTNVASTEDNHKSFYNKFAGAVSRMAVRRAERFASRIRGYTSNKKPDDLMTDTELALYRDVNCDDIRRIAKSLDDLDKQNGIDNSHLYGVLDQLMDTNMLIRYRLNKSLGRDGAAVLNRVNGVRVGYVTHGLAARGEGSNLETFQHELTHVPLEFLSLDPSANNKLLQLYRYVSNNITMDHFDYGDAEDRRIMDYLFKDPTTSDPHLEFLDYAINNARFRAALRNLTNDKNMAPEFESKIRSIFNRFLGTLKEGKKPDILDACDKIFKRSLAIAKHYYDKNPTVPAETFSQQRTLLDKANLIFEEGLNGLLTKVFGGPVGATQDLAFMSGNPEIAPERAFGGEAMPGRASEVFTHFVDLALKEVPEGKQELANQLAQSFKAVDSDNWEYVKLRLGAKECVDKVRERGASAVNKVISELTKNISTKTLNNMTEYVVHADLQCLRDGRTADETLKLIQDPTYRYNEIKKLEKQLMSTAQGNFFINSAKGLSNKLLYGVNTSGIGYNNAYEIANLCGTRVETTNSPNVSAIDQLVTLYTVHELNKKNPKVYEELTKNKGVLQDILEYHSGLIELERNSVYGDSLQKYHIPKGEVHGGMSKNRFEVIPEDVLDAYKWVGYRKVREVKLDPLYKSLLKKKYVLVEAKFMPDVPFSDGATVLTDIFKGRNKSTGYIGGTKVEEENFDVFYEEKGKEKVVNYLNEQVKRLNKPGFTQLNPKSIDGVFSPSFGLGASIIGCDFLLNEKEKNQKLGKNFKFTSVLGDHYGSILERVKAPAWNTKVAEALDEAYEKRAKKTRFTWLTENEEKKERQELYKLIPFEVREYFENKYPGKGVPIEEAYITGILGYRHASASVPDTEYKELEATTKDYIKHILHSAPVAYGESLAKYLAQIGKENIVIKGAVTSINNIISNCVSLAIQGLSPDKVCKYQVEGLRQLKSYTDMAEKYNMLLARSVLGEASKADIMQMKAYEDAMSHSPIGYLADKGAIPQIAEDLTQSDRLTKDLIDKYLPRRLQQFAHNAVGDQKSWAYSRLSHLATFGDITAKYALFRYLTEEKQLNRDEAARQCVQSFIDYSNPLPKELQYMDSIGALPFTKFLIGNQTNIVNSLMRNPVGAMSWLMANSWMNVSDIYGSILGVDSITNRWHMPGFGLWYQSLASLPIVRATGAAASIL